MCLDAYKIAYLDSTTFQLNYGLFPHFGALYKLSIFKLHNSWQKNGAILLIVC